MFPVWEANPVAWFRRAREHAKGQTGTADSHGEGRGCRIQLHSFFIPPGGLFALSCLSVDEVALFFCRPEQWPCTQPGSRAADSRERPELAVALWGFFYILLPLWFWVRYQKRMNFASRLLLLCLCSLLYKKPGCFNCFLPKSSLTGRVNSQTSQHRFISWNRI